MSSFDDLPIDPERERASPVVHHDRRANTPIIAASVLAVAVLGGALWFFFGRTRPPQPVPAAEIAAPAATAVNAEEPGRPAVVLPPMNEMDPFVRQMFSTLGSHPQLVAWLATDDLVGSIATAIGRLSQGQSPSRDLAAMRPKPGFATVTRRGVTYVDRASYARYDPLVLAATSIEPAKLAEVFVTLEPRLAEAYSRQGYRGTLRDAVQRAAATVVATPDTPEEIQLVPGVGGFAYANPQLQSLPAAQRHLVRMGPANVARLREAVRQFAVAVAAAR